MYTQLYFVGILKRKNNQVLQCPELTNPEWGTVNITQNARGLFTAVYKCMPQYSISGDRLRFCSPTSGQWSGSTPRCLPSKTFYYSLRCIYLLGYACICMRVCCTHANIKLLSSACCVQLLHNLQFLLSLTIKRFL